MLATVKPSSHKAEVVEITLEKHPQADLLSVANIHGYTCCVRTEDWANKTRGVFIPPDSLVDVGRPEFSFLAKDVRSDGKARIKARKLRGVRSFGILVPAPEGAKLGDDLAEVLGVEHYEPELEQAKGEHSILKGSENQSGPPWWDLGKYDLESFLRYGKQVFSPGEQVVLHEKLDGSNSRIVYWEGKYYVGSRTGWKREYPDYSHITLENLMKQMDEEKARMVHKKIHENGPQRNQWWQALHESEQLMKLLRDNPGLVYFGELVGTTNCIKYGKNRLVGFDFYRPAFMEKPGWLSYQEVQELANGSGLTWAPEVASLPFDFDQIRELTDGPSLHGEDCGTKVIREGVVVRPLQERTHPLCGRVVLKSISASYLEKYR